MTVFPVSLSDMVLLDSQFGGSRCFKRIQLVIHTVVKYI